MMTDTLLLFVFKCFLELLLMDELARKIEKLEKLKAAFKITVPNLFVVYLKLNI